MPRKQLVLDDVWLESNEKEIDERYERFKEKLKSIETHHSSLQNFGARHKYLGFNYSTKTNKYTYREWAPEAHKLELVGDFNNWDGTQHALTKTDGGIWEITFSTNNYFDQHETSKCKVRVYSTNGVLDRIPAYALETYQDKKDNSYAAIIRKERKAFAWSPSLVTTDHLTKPLIYECHVGMSLEQEKVSSFKEFTKEILPRIHKNGYNTIQLMAVQEHPYYGSFGYHVSNFFAVSCRFGKPEDLKHLINEAHKLGIAVVMDIVHSHAVKNWAEGLGNFDGSGHQYFHEGERGLHPQWDSLIFNYGKDEVLQFLLSNLTYWLEEFKFDGFRFDGVTSMMYHHHGLDKFTSYDKYFKEGVEWDAITYLQLATHLIKEINPNALIVAEDMSGMPGLCRKIEDGGIGFDFRLAMGIPDYWIKLLKEQRDEEWDLNELWGMLCNRRFTEKTISYAESHDQSLVGDKTLAFWLMDKHMYFDMTVDSKNHVIDRGIALHKMIRLLTATSGGEGYLTFIGNEFGHPEWIDFPREGNNWSFKHCKRQWSLVDNDLLKYKFLNHFDNDLVDFLKIDHFLNASPAQLLTIDTDRKVMVYEKANYIFVINWHPTASYSDFIIPINRAGKFSVVLDTDSKEIGGFNRINKETEHFSFSRDGEHFLEIYSPSRTGLVFKNKDID